MNIQFSATAHSYCKAESKQDFVYKKTPSSLGNIHLYKCKL